MVVYWYCILVRLGLLIRAMYKYLSKVNRGEHK